MKRLFLIFLIGIFLGATFVGYYVPGYSLGKIVPTLIGSIIAFCRILMLIGLITQPG